ncbi:MAG: ornithine carbamoyltransferase [Anaerolineaceae bacterium]|nr:ornithine carbamoyltransferase [Anaerolineaceae bacterium]
MQTDLRGRDMITTQEWTRDEIDTLLDVALDLKRRRATGEPHALLRDRVLGMLFFFSSTRTRISFEAGMAQLGGHAQFIESHTTQISHGDTAKEIGEIVGRYTDGIAIRQCDWDFGNRYIREVAAASRAPVLNMQCDVYHPFQILADLMTIMERFGRDLRGRTMNVSWAYAASYQKPISVPQSLILLMSRFGMNLRLTHPPEYKLMPDILQQAQDNVRQHGGSLELVDDFDAGFRDADILYPKSWGALLTTDDDEESARIGRQYTDWITDERRMALAQDHAVYMHCLPADRNIEVTDGVIDGPQSIVYDEAENRLHVQKATMALTMR